MTVTATSNEDVTVNLDGSLRAPKAGSPGAATAKKKTIPLAPLTFELQPDQPTALTLGVPKSGRKLLKRAFADGKKGKVTLGATATDDLGQTDAANAAVTLKKKKK